MCVGLGMLVTEMVIAFLVCWGKPTDLVDMAVASSYVLLSAAVVLFNAFRYTDFRLDRFYNTPMCPILDMVWDVEDLVIEPVEETDEPE